MQCPNCGKKEQVIINHKHYCANCGQPLSANTTPVAARPRAKPKKTGHVLDLSRSAHVPRQRRPAQSIHGVRKPTRVKVPVAHQPAVSPFPKSSTRQQRAAHVRRHPAISRFSSPAPAQAARFTARQATTQTANLPVTAMNPHHSYSVNGTNSPLPVLQSQLEAPVLEEQSPIRSRRRKSHVPKKAWRALKDRPRLVATAAVLLVVLVLAGYVTYVNVPGVAVRVAAARAGIDGTMPRYQPPGYEFSGPVAVNQGKIVIRLASKTENNFLTITQQRTGWEPASLVEDYVLNKSQNYRTHQQNGLTIYVYSDNNASWINNGILYIIEGNTQLTEDHILRMATSL